MSAVKRARVLTTCCCFSVGLALTSAHAADEDALDLSGAPAAAPESSQGPRIVLEAATGRIEQRGGLPSRDAHRGAIDFRHTVRFGPQWQGSFSDRLVDLHPVIDGQRSTRNSLREASLSWTEEAGPTTVDVGRINWRNGPAFGYNPTDYFKTGALRTVTTADPVALRENRLGTFMLRASRLLNTGSVTLALAPKLADAPSDAPFSLDAGATNNNDRVLLTYSDRFKDTVSGQLLLLAERGKSAQFGASFTALVSNTAVVYAEASAGRSARLIDELLGPAASADRRQHARLATGFTYTFPTRLSLTLEAEFNNAGLDYGDWGRLLASGPANLARYAAYSQANMEVGSRRAWMAYASQKDAGIKNLDIAGLVRTNAVDDSSVVWLEARYHWARFDAAVQLQRSTGSARSEYGMVPYRQTVQLIADWYF